MYFAGCFVLPIASSLERPVKFHRSGAGAIIGTTTAVPALFRVQDNGSLAFYRVGDINIHLADFHAVVAAGTDIRVENHRISRADDIR